MGFLPNPAQSLIIENSTSLKTMKIPSGGGVGMVNSPLATHGELKLPFVTRGEFIIPTTCGFATRGRNYTIPTPPPEGIEAMAQFRAKVQDASRCTYLRFQTPKL